MNGFIVPDDLAERDQWVMWRREQGTKVPYRVDNRRASTTNPDDWSDYATVVRTLENGSEEFAGIGFVFGTDDPYVGVDLDNCLEGGEVKPWARALIERFSDTYAEISPSGKGVKIFVKAKLAGRGKRKEYDDHAIEIYDRGRFFAVTGQPLNGAPLTIEDHQTDVDTLYKSLEGPSKNGSAPKPGKIPKGQRHNTLVSLAGTMRKRGMSLEAIDAALSVENSGRCEPPYNRQHIRKIAESATPWEPASECPASDLLCQPHTDTGNAERLVALYGRDIRFCSETKKWSVWDGRRWNSEDTRRVKMLAKRTMRQMYVQTTGIKDPNMKEAAEKHARRSESSASINSMLACAEYEGGIPVSASDFDQNKYLLNLLDGTLDLSTGRMREHHREDLISKLVHFNFNPKAGCPIFRRFLDRIMGGGPDASEGALERAGRMARYLQKCFGSALTGDVSDKAVFCFFGSGNNGKTTLLEVIRFILAEYSTQVLVDSLMAHHSRESNASLADLSDLRGARFVTTSEAEEGQRLAVGKLKYLTQGGGVIKTCRKYENPIEFSTNHKLFLDANHKPVIRGAEKAVWNRLKTIPFTVTITAEEMDKALLEKLKGEAEGILAWMIEGCRYWLEVGLGDPPEVTQASADWEAESDRFPAFLEETCRLEKEAWVAVSLPWPAYQNWCQANNERLLLSKSDFDGRLRQLGCVQGKTKDGSTRIWKGIRFKTPADDKPSDIGQIADTNF